MSVSNRLSATGCDELAPVVTSIRELASARIKPIVGTRGWRVLRNLDVRGTRERRRKALTAEITREVRAREEKEQRKRARQTLSVLARSCPLTASQRLVMGELEAFLTGKPKARVAIIGGPETATLAGLITRRFPGSTCRGDPRIGRRSPNATSGWRPRVGTT